MRRLFFTILFILTGSPVEDPYVWNRRFAWLPKKIGGARTWLRAYEVRTNWYRPWEVHRRTVAVAAALAVLVLVASAGASAQQATVRQEPVQPGKADGLTIQDCLGVLAGLGALDAGYRYIVAEGKPSESAETRKFKLPVKVQDVMSHDLFVLGQVQQEAQAANRRAQLDIIGDDPEVFKDGSKKALIFNDRMTTYTARPCRVELDHVREADLDRAHNDIPASVMSLLTKIIDR